MFFMLRQELLFYFNNAKEAIVISFLFIAITLVIPFAFPASRGLPEGVGGAMLWVALLAATQTAAAQSWQRHADSGELELLPLRPQMLEATVLGKSFAFFLMLMLQIMLIVPLSSLWLGFSMRDWPRLWLGLGLGALSFTFLYQLAAGLIAGQRKAGAVLGMVVLPFAIPVIIFGVSYTNGSLLWGETLLFLGGYAVFLAPLHAIVVASSIRHGH